MAMNDGEGSVGRVGHELIGAEYLKGLGFGDKVTQLVASHVAAKRCVLAYSLPSFLRFFSSWLDETRRDETQV